MDLISKIYSMPGLVSCRRRVRVFSRAFDLLLRLRIFFEIAFDIENLNRVGTAIGRSFKESIQEKRVRVGMPKVDLGITSAPALESTRGRYGRRSQKQTEK
jgi:hypothetical protein